MQGWLIGVLLSLVGCSCSNLGLNCQKYSYIENERLPLGLQKRFYYQRFWLFGMTIFLAGQVVNLWSFGYASQSLLAVLGSFSLVCNAFFAPLILKETFQWQDAVSIVVIICGSVIVVFACEHQLQEYSVQTLFGLYSKLPFIVYLSLIGLGSSAIFLLVTSSTTEDHDKSVDLEEEEEEDADREAKKRSLLVCALAACLASMSVLFGKCSVHLVQDFLQALDSTASRTQTLDEFKSPFSLLILVTFVFCGVQSVRYLNMALRVGEAMTIVPAYYVMSTILTIAGGMIYFQEYKLYSLTRSLYMGGGVCLTLLGVMFASQRDADPVSSAQDESDPGDVFQTSTDLTSVQEETAEDHVSVPLLSYQVAEIESSGRMQRRNQPRAMSEGGKPPAVVKMRRQSRLERLSRILVPATSRKRTFSLSSKAYRASFVSPLANAAALTSDKPTIQRQRTFSVALFGMGVT